MGLMAHGDTNYVSEELVRAVPEPEFTDTWHPVGHARVLDVLERGVAEQNLRVTSREYSLNDSGTRMFGVWGLDDMVKDGMSLAIGFRNAIDKTMKLGFCAGVTVFVCDNLALSGSFIRFRKHTAGLTDESLEELTMDAVNKVVAKMEGYRSKISDLKNIPVIEGPSRNRFALRNYPEFWEEDKGSDKDGTVHAGLLHEDRFKALMLDMALEHNVFPFRSIPKFADEFLTEAATAVELGYPVNSWYTVFNSITRMARGENMFKVSVMTAAAERMIYKVAGINIANGEN